MFRPNLDEPNAFKLDVSPLLRLHTDAGSQFDSPKFRTGCLDTAGINITLAAPKHQEQNGLCERTWQSIRNTLFPS
jgi:transposase InsO family protein